MPPIPYDKIRPLETPDLTPLSKPRVHDACQREIRDLFRTKDELAILWAQMEKRIRFWLQDPDQAKQKSEWFKHEFDIVEGGKSYPCYSLRFNRSLKLGNLRILYLTDDGEMILMHAFKERNTESNYRHAKEVVRMRLKEGI